MQNYIGMRVNAVTVNWQTVPFLLKIIYHCPKDLTRPDVQEAGGRHAVGVLPEAAELTNPRRFFTGFQSLFGECFLNA